jgi:hypothetical protein
MKKTITLIAALLAVVTLVIAGCKDKVPQESSKNSQTPGTMLGSVGAPQKARQPEDLFQGLVHKGKVATTMNAAGYTYVEIEENGKKTWAAVMGTKLKAGDAVEFPDAAPMENFYSKTLDRTFPSIIFSPAIKVNGVLQAVPAAPATGMGGPNPHAGMKSEEVK